MASRAFPVRRIILLATLAFALALSASFACVPSAHAATKADVVAKVETLGLPQHLMGIGYGVAKAVDFDAATGDAIVSDIDRAVALLAGRSIYELGAKDSAALIELCAASLMRVGVQTEYAFNPAGGADITLSKDGAVIAKFNTRDSGVVRTGGEALPWSALAGAALALALASACAVALRRGRKTAVAALSCMLAVPLALAAAPAFADPAPADGPAPVTSVVLTLTEPVAGEQASDALVSAPQMAEAGLAWEHSGQPFAGAFVEGEEYTACISLVSDTPFSEGVSVTVNGQTVQPMLQPDYPNALQCSVSFTAKAASLEPIDGAFKVVLDRPLPDQALSARADVTVDGKVDPRVSAKVAWTDADGAQKGSTDSVEAGASYTASVTLTTEEGFCFGEGSVVLMLGDGAVVSETTIADSERGMSELSRSFSEDVVGLIQGEIRVYMNDPLHYGVLPTTFKVTVDGKVDGRVRVVSSWTWDPLSGYVNGYFQTLRLQLLTGDGWCFAGGQQAALYLCDDESTWEHAKADSPTKPGDTAILMVSEVPVASIPEGETSTFGGCTVVSLFGENAPETEALRSFRDGALSQSSLGQGLTSLYYEIAPHVTALLNDVPALKPAARAVVGWAAHAVA